ncbi:NUDIX domain-containing protein [Mucilaginibacter sp. RS28]|uniref:NUDIX domain-containing protein n=1 Tax=Mucilaginibacter straminoryzae TaxID=2932774 RepID=A0A9X2BEA9_9SPHI|nr:NUDIX domain-containing protein [Mucilaginibacter straminoryzae]MCJ8211218.1 NUDIX domain-containing protein [Mucilaginibacter straminoryzae]
MALFNVRVYGLLINEYDEILISDEQEYGFRFTKFPGGGLELGEGLIDGLKREFMEECNAEIEVLDHFYTTDFYVKSAFNDSQIISVYYWVKALSELNLNFKTRQFDFDGEGEVLQAFRWLPVEQLSVTDMTFPIDQHVVKLLKQQ